MSHPLDGIWAKVKRVDEHIKNLNGDITDFLNSNAYSVIGKPNDDAREHILSVVGPEPPLRFSVIAGEIIHQCRSALDHLISQLVIVNGGTPSNRHEFPICDRPEKFKEARDRGKISGIAATAANIIESLQPYNNRKGFQWHPLWVLHDMDVTDKHKLLVVVVANVSIFELCIDPGQPNAEIIGCSDPKWPARPTKDGTEVLRIKLGKPAPNMNVNVKPTVQIAFEKYGPVSKQPVIHCVDQLRNVAVGTVIKFVGELKHALTNPP